MFSGLFTPQKPALPTQIDGDRVFLRKVRVSDAQDWISLRLKNLEFHAPFSPLSSLQSLTFTGFKKRLAAYDADWAAGSGHAFLLFRQDNGRMIGAVNIGNVIRGAGQMATLGYWMDQDELRKGYMTQGVELACRFAFDHLRLHRVQAACLPDNLASIGVLEKCRFEREGLARDYIRINGVWRDHLLFARLSGQA